MTCELTKNEENLPFAAISPRLASKAPRCLAEPGEMTWCGTGRAGEA